MPSLPPWKKMEILSSFRDPALSRRLVKIIRSYEGKPLNFMEFCGTHTHAVFKYGIRQLLPEDIKMLSGPGCPVCVTDSRDINLSLSLARISGVIITTFGDLLKVPGSGGKSLQTAKAEGADIRIVYSTLDALKIARENKERPIIFLGIGFETTTPTVSAAILQAEKEGLENFFIFSMHKLTPPATRAILNLGEVHLDGIIGPGHVSTVIGSKAWEFLPLEYGVPFVVAGFEPFDILLGIEKLVEQCIEGRPRGANAYMRSVKKEGNPSAIKIMYDVFETSPALWRGLGEIPGSGLKLKDKYSHYDAFLKFMPTFKAEIEDNLNCRCGEVLRGVIDPPQCQLFKKVCSPDNPLGPCMVSSEGACSAYYLYGNYDLPTFPPHTPL